LLLQTFPFGKGQFLPGRYALVVTKPTAQSREKAWHYPAPGGEPLFITALADRAIAQKDSGITRPIAAGGSRKLPRMGIQLVAMIFEPNGHAMLVAASADVSGSRLFIAHLGRANIGFLRRALDLPRAKAAPSRRSGRGWP